MNKRKMLVVLGCVFLLFGAWLISFSPSNGNVGLSNNATASTPTIYVDVNHLGDPIPPNGNSSHPFLKIQDGIDNASPGETVNVSEGVYYETISINQPLNLVGEGKDNTIIDGENEPAGKVVDITANVANVNISGFTIEKAARNPYYGIDAESENSKINITENMIYRNAGAGIYTNQSSNITIANNEIVGNEYAIYTLQSLNITIANNEILDDDSGVAVRWTEPNATVTSNIISYNNISGILISGILTRPTWALQLLGCNYTNVIDNNIADVTSGILVEEGGFENISGNVENNVLTTGLELESGCNSTFENNIINDAQRGTYGIYVIGDQLAESNNFSNNHVTNFGYGMWGQTTNMLNNIVAGNTFGYCGYGVYLDNTSSNCLCHNNFVSNSQSALYDGNYSDSIVWYQSYPCGGNYWSDGIHIDTKWGENQDKPGGDMIVDTPYVSGNVNDTYPLMHPWPMLNFTYCEVIGGYSLKDLYVAVITSSNITNFLFNNTGISFNVNATGTNDSCVLIIPYLLLNGAFNLVVDSDSGACCIGSSRQYHRISFTYDRGIHDVQITAEFVNESMIQLADILRHGKVDLGDLVSLAHVYGQTVP